MGGRSHRRSASCSPAEPQPVAMADIQEAIDRALVADCDVALEEEARAAEEAKPDAAAEEVKPDASVGTDEDKDTKVGLYHYRGSARAGPVYVPVSNVADALAELLGGEGKKTLRMAKAAKVADFGIVVRDDKGDVKTFAYEDMLAPGVVYIVIGKERELPMMKRKREEKPETPKEPEKVDTPEEPEMPKVDKPGLKRAKKGGRPRKSFDPLVEHIIAHGTPPDAAADEIVKAVDGAIGKCKARIYQASTNGDKEDAEEHTQIRDLLHAFKKGMGRDAGGKKALMDRSVAKLKKCATAAAALVKDVEGVAGDFSLYRELDEE